MSVRPAYGPTDSKYHVTEHAQTRFAERFPKFCDGLHPPAIVRRMIDLITQYDEAKGQIPLQPDVRTTLALAHSDLSNDPRPEALCYITDPEIHALLKPGDGRTPATVALGEAAGIPIFVSKDYTIVTVLTPADFFVLRQRAEKATRTVRQTPARPETASTPNGKTPAPDHEPHLMLDADVANKLAMLTEHTGEPTERVINHLLSSALARIEKKHPELFRPRLVLAQLIDAE